MARIKEIFKYLNFINTRGFWAGFIAGFFYFSYIFWWFWSIYPLDSLGLHNKFTAATIIFLIFIFCVLSMALFWGLFGIIAEKIYRKNISTAFIPLALASAFTLAEFLRSIFFSILWYGSGGMIGPYWPIGNMAYLFVDIAPISLTASIWGMYGIEFIFSLLASTSLILFLKPHKRILILELIAGLLILISGIYLSAKFNKNLDNMPEIPVAIIQTNTPAEGFDSSEDAISDLQNKLTLLEKGADQIKEGIVVLPEGTNLTKSLSRFLDSKGIENYFKKISENEILVIDSIRSSEDESFRSKSVFISSKDGVIGSYDKQILTPGGEFLPYIIKTPLILAKPSLLEEFKSYREYAPGEGSNIISYKNYTIKSLICSELISPAKASQGNANLMIITGSFSMWKGSRLATGQALAMTRFRAMENGKYTILTSNSGLSYIINPSGNVDKMTSAIGYELLTGYIAPNNSQTWYNYLGDWPILLLSSVLFGFGLKKIKDDIES